MVNQNEERRSYGEPGEGGEDVAPGPLGPIDPMEVVEGVSTFARENPHAALAGAFALGFLLGGGLTPRLLGTVALFAGRAYFSRTVRDVLDGALREQLGDGERMGA